MATTDTTNRRPEPLPGYAYCTPTCYCKNCRRVEDEARAHQADQARVAEALTLIGDERIMDAMYAGTCARCGQRFAAGTRIAYSRQYRTARHASCAAGAASAATCPGCGVQGNPRTWSSTAIYGPACPDCYDRLSE